MQEGVQEDPIYDGTLRPKQKPILEGKGLFKSFICVDFQSQMNLPCNVQYNDPISIFSLFFTDNILL